MKLYRFTEAQFKQAADEMAQGYLNCNGRGGIVARNQAVVRDFFNTKMQQFAVDDEPTEPEPEPDTDRDWRIPDFDVIARMRQQAYRNELVREFALHAPDEIPGWFQCREHLASGAFTVEQRYFQWRWFYAENMVAEIESQLTEPSENEPELSEANR